MNTAIQSAHAQAEAIRKAVEARAELVRELYMDLHAIPEIAHQEFETTKYIKEFLGGRGITLHPSPTGTGGYAVIGSKPPFVLLRADIDALPVTEETGATYCSTNEGMMHACGHDAHAAILLATVDALVSDELELDFSIIAMFQPAEEGPGGCLPFIEDGFLEKFDVVRAYALHLWPGLKTGQIGLTPGPVMAAMDTMNLTFRGKGGHGAHPQDCIDPITAAADAILTMHTVITRKIDPLDPSLISFGLVHGGTARNIIPDHVDVGGTLRWLRPEVQKELWQGVERVAKSVAKAHGATCEVELASGFPPTVNDKEATEVLREALGAVLGAEALTSSHPTMGSEDMSFMLEKVQGCYMQLGAGPREGEAENLHSSRFLPELGCLEVGIAAMLTAALCGAPFSI